MRCSLVWTVVLAVFLIGVGAEESTCKCSKILTGQWKATFAETVVPGYSRTAKVSMKHLYSEVYTGAFLFPSMFPFTPRYRMDYLGYLNGTSCQFRGSLANVLQRLTVVFKMEYDGANSMKGSYHRSTFFSDDDHFVDISMEYEQPGLDNELRDAMDETNDKERFQNPMGVAVQ